MSDIQHGIDAKRDQSEEYKMGQVQGAVDPMAQFVDSMGGLAANRDVDLAAGMRSTMSNPLNEGHLAGGEHGDSTNAIGDEVRDEAERNGGQRGIAGYERDIVAAQSMDAKYLNPTMQNDAFQASMEAEQMAAIEQDAGGADVAAAAAVGASDMPRDLDEHTAQSAEGGILGAGNPVTGKEGALGGGMGAALAQAREGGVMQAFGQSGMSMGGGGNSLFKGSSMATPGLDQARADKAEQQDMLPQRK